MKLARIIALAALITFSIVGCNNEAPENNNEPGGIDVDDGFVPVTNITGVKTSVPVGTVTLSGRVVPTDSTNKTILWSLQDSGDTEGTLIGNRLTTKWEGTVRVRATVEHGLAVGENYTKNFTIFVDRFVPVRYLNRGFPETSEVGELFLDGYVDPDNASYTDIVWSIKDAGTTRATIRGDVLTTRAEGTVVVFATIIDGTAIGTPYISEDFYILITDS